MNTRSVLRWTLVVVIALGMLGAIGLALGGVPLARATGATHIYPGPGCGPTLTDCIAAVPPGDVIQIKAGVYTESVALNKGVSLIGQGWATTELRAEPRKRVLTIDDSTNPITESAVISGLMLSNGQALGAACPAGCGGGILITGTARPALQNLMLDDNQAAFQGGGLWVNASPLMVLRHVSFVTNTSTNAGGGLYTESDAQLWDSNFQDNASGSYGGGAYVSGTAQLNGGLFQGNHVDNLTSAYGGGLYAADAVVQGTQFVSNIATSVGCSACFGGGLYLGGGGASSLDNVTFAANHSFFGGGLYSFGDITLTNGVIVGNIADSQGGGAYVSGLTTLSFGRFEANKSTFAGGGLYASSMTSVGTHFLNNTAVSGAGGGAYVFGAAQLQTVRFENNASSTTGAGLYAGSLAGQDAWFVGNQTQFGDGGGAYVAYLATRRPSLGLGMTDLQNSFFFHNVSGGSGGGLAGNGSITLTKVIMVGNTATTNGGGVYGSTDVSIVGGVYERNVGGNGGALYAFGPLNVSLATLHGNEANGGSGGGAYANATALINGGSFLGNSAPVANGGGLYAFNQADIFNTAFISNSASGGGGVSSDIVNLTDVNMTDNWASADGVGDGGAVKGITVTVVRGVYNSNWAEGNGGAIYAAGSLGLNDTQVTNNYVNKGRGGGAYSNAGAEVDHSAFTKNTAYNGNGGGLYLAGLVTVTRSTFVGNSGLDGSGLYKEFSGDGRIVNSLFASNHATPTLGSELSINGPATMYVLHTTIADQALNPSNGINVAGRGVISVVNSIVVNHNIGLNVLNGTANEDYSLYAGNVVSDLVGVLLPGIHSLHGVPPLFSDAVNNDYHLRVKSPGTNAGTLLPDVLTDFDNQSRPMGGPNPDIGFDEVGLSIQEMIKATGNGGTVYVPAGAYTESLTLDRPVNLVGAGSDTNAPAVIHALPGSRVLTVTGQIDRLTRIADLQLVGGNIAGPCPTFCGGGVLVTGGANPTFDNVAVEFNQADFGGGLYLDGSGAQLLNSRVMNNVATQSGGGVYVAGFLEQHGGLIASNRAADGAGMFVQDGLYQLYNGAIENNTAKNWGGGLLVAGPGARAELHNSNVMSNSTSLTPSAKGGGIFVDGGQAWLEATQMISNTSVRGGGVFISGTLSARADVVGGSFIGNAVTQSGGGLYALSSYGITGTRFFQNLAGTDSAVLNQAGGFGRVVNAFVVDNQPGSLVPSIMTFGGGAKAQVLHTTFGNNGAPRGYAVTVASGGQVAVVDTIVATYTRGLYNAGGVAVEDYNLYAGNTADFAGTIFSGTHSLHAPNPIFVDPAVRNFHIRGFSPAVNRGTNVGVRRDIDLDPRPLGGGFDIGADEASVAGTNADPIGGGTFTYTTTQNSTINMVLPPGAVTQTTPLYCSLLDNITVQPPHSLMFAGVVFELDAQTDPNGDPGSISFNTPVTLSVSYTDQQLVTAGITNEQQLKLYRFETSVNQWEPIGFRDGETQTLDVANNVITATILSFSRFGTMGPSSTSEVFLPLISRNYSP